MCKGLNKEFSPLVFVSIQLQRNLASWHWVPKSNALIQTRVPIRGRETQMNRLVLTKIIIPGANLNEQSVEALETLSLENRKSQSKNNAQAWCQQRIYFFQCSFRLPQYLHHKNRNSIVLWAFNVGSFFNQCLLQMSVEPNLGSRWSLSTIATTTRSSSTTTTVEFPWTDASDKWMKNEKSSVI